MAGSLSSADVLIGQIRKAVGAVPLDWDLIRSAAISLDIQSETKQQVAAVEKLKSAADLMSVLRATLAAERAFLQGKPGADGWPRNF